MTQTPSAADRLQAVPFDQLLKEIQAGQHEADLQAVFGATLAAEMTGMADKRPAMMSGERPLVILLPGIMGSTLDNTMGQTGRIWIDLPAILAGRLRLLTLNEQAQPLDPSVNIQPNDLVASVYLPMRIQLGWFGGCDVRVLPFDWRYPPAAAAERLHTLINGLRATTKRRVHLVGHSMGGLVARAYCTLYRDEAARNVAQVIMLGTPNAGSIEAIRNLTVGNSLIGLIRRLTRSDSVFDFVRSIPGAYSLLPVPTGGYAASKRPYPFEVGFDPYRIPDYRTEGLSANRLAEAATALAIPPIKLPVPTMVLAGTGVKTAFGVQLEFNPGELPHFEFEKYSTLEGDGTVLVSSAIALPGVSSRYIIEGCHGDLPLYPNVRRAVLKLVHGDDPSELPERIDRGMMDAPARAEHGSVPATPTPGALSAADIEHIATRIEAGNATPEDIALLTRGW